MSVYRKKWTGQDGRVRTKWMVHIKHKRHDGTHQVIRRVSPINTRRAAEVYERELRQEFLPGARRKEEEEKARPAPPEVPTFGDFSAEFMAYQATLNKPTELQSKRSILEHHLLPAFGTLALDRIDARKVDRYKVRKLAGDGGLSPKTVNNHLAVLGRALRVARKWGMLAELPELEPLRVPRQGFDFLDFGESERYLAGAREHEPDWHPFVLVAMRTGLRVGEMLALRWGDVRLDRRQLRVERGYTRAGGIGSTKSGRAREVPLARDALGVLAELRQERLGDDLVFPGRDGSIGSLRSAGHFVGKVARKAGLRHVHPHMLRHTFASHAVMRGVPVRIVQEWLGHASIEMTMRYAHLAEGIGQGLIDRLCPDAPDDAPVPRSTIGAHDLTKN